MPEQTHSCNAWDVSERVSEAWIYDELVDSDNDERYDEGACIGSVQYEVWCYGGPKHRYEIA